MSEQDHNPDQLTNVECEMLKRGCPRCQSVLVSVGLARYETRPGSRWWRDRVRTVHCLEGHASIIHTSALQG